MSRAKYNNEEKIEEVIDLKTKLIESNPIFGPSNTHEQSGFILPPDHSVLQHQLQDLLVFTNKNKMKTNTKKKTKISHQEP